ncbi:hypothetical protein [Cryobacterium sp. TMT4-31]|uniref:hypothetical protein n=1 Tax=Cryobacterium sp. TMT4-31 TaxID=1259259 RepID=UPI00106D26CA|nr:hypothetical protein [Cryobacterium sp. TMT4-31]TFC87767.1 hypothetical protein E3T19_11590 [Cryobacterium sp. TMT4-31]
MLDHLAALTVKQLVKAPVECETYVTFRQGGVLVGEEFKDVQRIFVTFCQLPDMSRYERFNG